MRFPCSDGVDRDIYIEEFIDLTKEENSLEKSITELKQKLFDVQYRRTYLLHIHLGFAGLKAAQNAELNK